MAHFRYGAWDRVATDVFPYAAREEGVVHRRSHSVWDRLSFYVLHAPTANLFLRRLSVGLDRNRFIFLISILQDKKLRPLFSFYTK